MCGILACFSPRGEPVDTETFRGLLDTLQHRGPDDSGIWSLPEAGVVMGHRRLSILDLSPLGHQPMHCCGGRWTLLYNGEIYNWKDMRDRLVSAGVSFRSTSDTEVLLEGISKWGLEATLRQCVGVFAIAVWDREERKMYIARDRMGEKPLYYGWKNGTWWIASELK
nr:asparagine synthetase B [bacterium]